MIPQRRDTAGRLARGVRGFGLLSAARVADRYATIVEQALGTDPASAPSAAAPSSAADAQWPPTSPAQLVGSYLAVLDAVADLARGPRPGDGAVEQVPLPPAIPGSASVASLWLHNDSAQVVRTVAVGVSDLTSAGGGRIPTTAVEVSPPAASIAPGASAEIRFTVLVPPRQEPGWYHGIVMASAAPGDPLVLSLSVEGGEAR